MILEQARVTSKGQVTIPKNVRDAMKLNEGSTIVFTSEDGVHWHLSAGAHESKDVFAKFAGTIDIDEESTEELRSRDMT
jgi:AbrB family looped-hinge helix DNA binding protein